jgi:uncharacterized membrane protein
MIFSIIKGLISPITELAKGYQERKKQIKEAEHEVKMSVIKNRQRLAEETQSHNSDKEMLMLEKATPWVRWVITFHILALVDVSVLFPAHAVIVFDALESMPKWVVGLFVTIFGFYFAVSKLTEHGADLVKMWKGKTG